MKTLRKPTLVMLLLAAVLMAGCKKETEPENNGNNGTTETVGHKNPNPAQDTPLSEHFLSEFESIYQLYPNPDGSFYALAGGEYTDYLLKLDNNGYVQQRTELGFRSRRCITKSGDNIVLMGNLGHTSSPYSMEDQGYVAVYDQNMQSIATIVLKEFQYKIELNTLIQDTQDPTLFYAGGLAIDESYIQYPYLCTLQFSDGQMTKVSSKIYSEYARYRIMGMVEKQVAGQKDLILEAIQYTLSDNPNSTNHGTVKILKLNYFEEESGWGSETWDVAIEGPNGGSYAANNSIDADENNIYFFGLCKDYKNNSLCKSAIVAAVNWHQGQVVWTKTLAISNLEEHLYDGILTGGYLYVCGLHSGVNFSSTKYTFSIGLVAKFSLSGECVAYKTFGESDRYSYFINLVKESNGNIVCVGRSGENLGNDKTKWSGWFLKTDISSSGSSKALSDSGESVEDEIMNDMDAGNITISMDSELHYDGI